MDFSLFAVETRWGSAKYQTPISEPLEFSPEMKQWLDTVGSILEVTPVIDWYVDGKYVGTTPLVSQSAQALDVNVDHAPGAQNPETDSTIAVKQPEKKIFSGNDAIKSAVEYGFTFIEKNFDTKVREYGFLIYKVRGGVTISPIVCGALMATNYSVAHPFIPNGSLLLGNAHTHPPLWVGERVKPDGWDLSNVRIKREMGEKGLTIDGLRYSKDYRGYLQNATDPRSVLSYWGPAASQEKINGEYPYQKNSYNAWSY